MKNNKHLQARIAYCLALAECSVCPRRKFGAVIFDPETNTDVSAGYNGPPRGGPDGALCSGGSWCLRDGLKAEDVQVQACRFGGIGEVSIRGTPEVLFAAGVKHAEAYAATLPCDPIPSGERTEIGCHHAEANAIANAARRGAALEGCAIVVTGEPCLACAKLIHHVGIGAVYCVKGGYAGGGAGPKYLRQHGVVVDTVDGPPDPRLSR